MLSGAYRKSDYSMIVIISINKRSILKKPKKSRGSKYTSFFYTILYDFRSSSRIFS
nr:MAG TPA: hypothetical protein [Caudoviricetes sp.]